MVPLPRPVRMSMRACGRLAAVCGTALLLTNVIAPEVAAQRPGGGAGGTPLQTMSYEEADAAGTTGTGCTWLGGAGRTRRLAIADRRAVVRHDGKIVILRPARGSKRIPPWTYRTWSGGGLLLSIRDTGQLIHSGAESRETIAWLDLRLHGRQQSWVGQLDCGS